MKILVTGAAGFIGYHLINKLATQFKDSVIIGIDNFSKGNRKIKYDRVEKYIRYVNVCIIKGDINYCHFLEPIFEKFNFDVVIHLAAKAGVRESITDPKKYIDNNIIGFHNILEACRQYPVKHLIYASSSSVYGNQEIFPVDETYSTDSPQNIYAVTKKTNELMAECYHYLFNIPVTGLRFFSVYGTWGRKEMVMYLFTKSILQGEKIKLFNEGDMWRDFTHVDDVTDAIISVMSDNPETHEIYNVCNFKPIRIYDLVKIIEQETGIKADIDSLPLQPGEIRRMCGDNYKIEKKYGWQPKVNIKEGIKELIEWIKEYELKKEKP